MKFLLILPLIFLAACPKESEIRAKVWKGGVSEITRDLPENQEEFLKTSDPKFLNFRCVTTEDMDLFIRAALRHCSNSESKETLQTISRLSQVSSR